MKKALILCSGGLDSVVLGHYFKNKYDNLGILFFNYNQRSLKLERKFSRDCAKDIGADFFEINLDKALLKSNLTSKSKIKKVSRKDLRNSSKENDKWYVPFRNGIFISHAMAYAESFGGEVDILLGFKSEGKEPFPDATKKFVDKMNQVIKQVNSKISLKAPFISKDKEDLVKIGLRVGVDFNKTVSCYCANEIHCGKCLACALRKEGFYWAGIEDPTRYN